LTASPIGAAGPAAPFAETSGLTDEAPEAVASGAARLFPALPVSLQPDPSLLKYYALSSLALGPLCFFMLVPLYFRFRTLRYDIDEEGITMRWGILFRREVSLTFARIQDIHLTSNFVERWLGLGRIQVQTASGSASAEMTVEGIPAYEALRDFLYTRMRGARDGPAHGAVVVRAPGDPDGLTEALRSTAEELRAIRLLLEARQERHS